VSADSPSDKLLEQIPFFRGLNEAECRQLGNIARVEKFAPGEMVLRQGQSSRNLWAVLEGKCEVVRHKEHLGSPDESVVLAVLEPYSHFGEMSFFNPAPHSASVRAQTALKLLRIARSDYDELIKDGVAAAYKLTYNAVESLANRLRRMDEWIVECTNQNPVGERVPEWSSFRDKLFSGWNL
jgi:CRP/FNR family transcriptional regulator, cyclic AMP receptor protein